MASWRLTVRDGPNVRRTRHDTLDAALAELGDRVRAISPQRDEVKFLRRTIAPASQVSARLEIAGPQRLVPAIQGGLDLRGDGSSEAFTGHWRRRLIDQRRDEDALAALSRTLREQST